MANIEVILDKIVLWITTKGIKIVIGMIMIWFGFKIVSTVLKKTMRVIKTKPFDPSLISFLEGFLDISLKLLIIILVLEYIGVNSSSLTALVASAGVSIGFALKGTLSNFAGGVIILFLRPFEVGDSITCKGVTGTVEKIQIFHTYMVSSDNKQILIPNGKLIDDTVINSSVKPTRRVDLIFSIGYEDDILKAKKALWELIRENKLILSEPEALVAIGEQGENSVNIFVRVWCNKDDYWTVYYDMMENVKLKFDSESINIPYPQMDVHFKKE